MKKPIDPNLNNNSDDLFLFEDTADKPEASQNVGAVFDDTPSERENPPQSFAISEKTTESEHSHHHHHGSGEHHHSSGEHHHSSSSHHHSSSSKSNKKKKKKKLSTAAKIAIAFLILLLLIIFGTVFGILYLEQSGKNDLKANTSTSAEYKETIEYNGETYEYNDDIVSIAFIGVDKRELGLEDNKQGTAGQADADIVFTINTKTGKAKAISIPRDTMVDVDVYSENGIFLNNTKMQLCLSYAYGDGKETSATNVTTSLSRILYDVPINKYFALDLDGIQPINDSIGGVTLQSLCDFDAYGIKTGDTIHLTGGMTEMYVRHRDLVDINAALYRSQRQVQYVKAFASQLAPAVVDDFGIITRLYNTAMDYSTTNISLSNATYLATLLLSNGITDFESATVQGEMKAGTNTNPEVVYAEFYPDEEALMQLVLDTYYTKK